MNSIDLYEFSDSTSGTATPSAAPTAASAPQPSLEEEVNQVVNQLGRFWGGFKRQSTVALETARKDFSQVVVQAQAELGKITTTTGTASTSRAAGSSTEASAAAGNDSPSTEEEPSTPGPSTDKGKQPESPRASVERSGSPTTPTQPSINSFFSRLQSSLPPQLAPESITQTLQTIQKQVQPALATAQTAASTAALQAQHAASAAASQASQAMSQVDVSQYQRSLSGNFRKLQEAQAPMLAQAEKLAEEARHRSETLLKGAGEYLKDAVKVVPPEEGSGGVVGAWDGSDIWMYPSPIGTAGWGGSAGAKAVEEDKPRRSGDTMTYARVKRADALLARLKHDPELVKLGPEADETVRENYLKFVGEEIDGKGGIEGDVWSKKVKEALSDEADGTALKSTMDTLVPFEMTEETFWTRYFFRVHQIQEEEAKRKALLQATTQEEDFTWDDEDESEPTTSPTTTKGKSLVPPEQAAKASTPTPTKSNTPTPTPAPEQPATAGASSSLEAPAKAKAEAASVPSSSAASPRESEESFAVVSTGMISKEVSSKGSEEEEDEEEEDDEEEDEDDDEEEDEEDDDEEGEGEDSESDWE